MSIATTTLSRNRSEKIGITWAGVVGALLTIAMLAGAIGPAAWL